MPSTLYGIYNAQRALSLNQAAIDIINSNVANMNTKGYSKQRLEISQASNVAPYQSPVDATQSGMGAIIDSVTRNRDVFLDNSLRRETTDLNYYKEYTDNAVQLENIVNELDDTGLNKTLNDFYNSLSQLASNPNDFVVRNSVVQNAITLATTFNNTYTSLQNEKTGLVGDINNPDTLTQSKLSIDINDLNNKLSAVANLNDQINLSTSQGMTPNALLDQRDELLDKISEYIPVNITNERNNTVTLSIGAIELVRGKERSGFFEIQAGATNDNPSIVQIKNDAGSVFSTNAYSLITSGKIGAILQTGGDDPGKLTIKGIMDSLNSLASEFATAVNAVQTNGRYIDSSVNPNELSDNLSNPIPPSAGTDPDPEDFFVDSSGLGVINAGNISVNAIISNDPYQIAAAKLTSNLTETGDGSNALLMSQIRNQGLAVLGGATTQGYITNVTGKLGTQSKNIQDNYDIKSNILQQVTQKRESVIGVNLDEELTDLVRFQRSYEASAKVMQTLSQTLTTIINMMG
ncbi:MAG: flagellar hook-associated protein FlgK [Candidatus Melainabacteria bacterium GWA2_34_9]|nr:MAG: flagellar hook-associated protein FlgK [Candidatus Melainabacteria bacterium GWA2_34_9]